MQGTYTKQVLEKNARTILRHYGGQRNFCFMFEHYGNGRELIHNDPPHDSTWERFMYLSRTIPNFNPASYVYKSETMGDRYGLEGTYRGRTVYLKYQRVDDIYEGILGMACHWLYDKIQSGKYRPNGSKSRRRAPRKSQRGTAEEVYFEGRDYRWQEPEGDPTSSPYCPQITTAGRRFTLWTSSTVSRTTLCGGTLETVFSTGPKSRTATATRISSTVGRDTISRIS